MSKESRTKSALDRKTKKWRIALYIAVAVAAVLTAFIYFKNTPPPNGKYDAFAQCIKASGATFYGAFWCPHCQAEKALFGDSVRFLPYVECSTPDGSAQLQVCKDEGIQSYPTWVFKDGSRLSGTISLDTLAQKTGCPLPGGTQ